MFGVLYFRCNATKSCFYFEKVGEIVNKKVKEEKKKDSVKKVVNAKKKTKKKKDSFVKKGLQFLKDVRKELGKVRQPNKKEMIKYAGATLAFVVFFALFFLLADGIIWGLKQVMR